jgi:hypothetical protein
MTKTEQKIIDTSLDQLRGVHENMGRLWDADTISNFYYQVLTGTIARHGPEVAQAVTHMLSEKFDNLTKAHANLGRLAGGSPLRSDADQQ